MSLGQLAESAGVRKVALSQIEKGDSNRTINTIWKITGALQLPYTSLLELPETHAVHVKKADIHELVEDDALFFEASVPYCYKNLTDQPTKIVLLINYD